MTAFSMRAAARKLGCIVGMAARHRLSDRAAVLGRVTFYGLMLFVFSRLWRVIGEGEAGDAFDSDRFVWYVAVTEWILLSQPPLHTDVQDELRSGDLLYRLTRPVSFPVAKIAEAFGDLAIRMVPTGLAGVGFAYLLTGTLPPETTALLVLIPVGLLAASVAMIFHFVIGMTAVWLHDCRPVYWVWQKGVFLLGGLLVPLEYYPETLRQVAMASPFAAILHGPGGLVLHAELASGWPIVARLLLWLGLALALAMFVYQRSLRRLDGAGG